MAPVTEGDDNVPQVTQRIAPLGFHRREVGMAGVGSAGPNVKIVSPPWWEYVLVDVCAWAYATGWIAAAAFYGAGSFEMHGDAPVGELAIIGFISKKAIIPGAVSAVKDLGTWLYKRRQAHGLG